MVQTGPSLKANGSKKLILHSEKNVASGLNTNYGYIQKLKATIQSLKIRLDFHFSIVFGGEYVREINLSKKKEVENTSQRNKKIINFLLWCHSNSKCIFPVFRLTGVYTFFLNYHDSLAFLDQHHHLNLDYFAAIDATTQH